MPDTRSIPTEVDFDVHGLVGVRLVHPWQDDIVATARKLGNPKVLAREPDIIVRFTEKLPISSNMRFLDVDDAAFTDDKFLLIDGKHKRRPRMQIAFEQIGGTCEVVCEYGLPGFPLLIPLLNMVMLSKGILPLHASAFTFNGTGIVVTGWTKGGKTETLLAFMNRGAQFVGDEWVYISKDGRQAFGIPQPIRVWQWHLKELPEYRSRIARIDKLRWKAISLLHRVSAMPIPGTAMLHKLLPILRRAQGVSIHPERLFGKAACTFSGPFDCLFFVVSHSAPEIIVKPIDPKEVAQRMVFSLEHSRLWLRSQYLKFRFAFPENANIVFEQSERLQLEMLMRVFADKPAHLVCHPYPAAIPALFEAVSPLRAC